MKRAQIELLRLAFVRSHDNQVESLWSVEPSGNDRVDFSLGRGCARACLDYSRAFDVPEFFVQVVRAIISEGRWGPLEAGFFHVVSCRIGRRPMLPLSEVTWATRPPPKPPVFLPTKEVCRRVSYSKRHIDRLISQHRFPASIRIGHRTVVWRESDIVEWQLERERGCRAGNSVQEAET